MRARVCVGIEESEIGPTLDDREGSLILVIPHHPQLFMIPLHDGGIPPSDDDGIEVPASDGGEESLQQYLVDQLCAHAKQLSRKPHLDLADVDPGVYAVFPDAVFFLGLSRELRVGIDELVAAFDENAADPALAEPRRVMERVIHIVDRFSMDAFLMGLPPELRSAALFPTAPANDGLSRWLRSARHLEGKMHDYFGRMSFDSRRSRTSMLIMYNNHDGTLGTRFANRSAATSRTVTTLFDTLGGSQGRHIGRNEMISNGCTNDFRSGFGSGGAAGSLPGNTDDYSLTYARPGENGGTMTFANGEGDALIFSDGTYHERRADGKISWTVGDVEYVAYPNDDGTYDIEGTDGSEWEDVELSEELTEDEPSIGEDESEEDFVDGVEDDDDDGGRPRLDRVAPTELVVQYWAQQEPERFKRIIALANGGGRKYPSPLGGFPSKPNEADFNEGLNDLPGSQRDTNRINPGPPHHSHGRRGHSPTGRPVKLRDTPGYTNHAPPGVGRPQSGSRKTRGAEMVFAERADLASALLECMQQQIELEAQACASRKEYGWRVDAE